MDKKSQRNLSRQKLKREKRRDAFKALLKNKHVKTVISKKVAIVRSLVNAGSQKVNSEANVFDRKAWSIKSEPPTGPTYDPANKYGQGTSST